MREDKRKERENKSEGEHGCPPIHLHPCGTAHPPAGLMD